MSWQCHGDLHVHAHVSRATETSFSSFVVDHFGRLPTMDKCPWVHNERLEVYPIILYLGESC